MIPPGAIETQLALVHGAIRGGGEREVELRTEAWLVLRALRAEALLLAEGAEVMRATGVELVRRYAVAGSPSGRAGLAIGRCADVAYLRFLLRTSVRDPLATAQGATGALSELLERAEGEALALCGDALAAHAPSVRPEVGREVSAR